MLRNFKVLLAVFAVIVIAGSAYAFAAANTVPATNAGYAASEVSGYTVDSIVYDLNDTNPTAIAKITFDINPSTGSEVAKFVRIQTATSGSWTTCTLVAGTAPEIHVTCTTTVDLDDVTALNVVASSSLNPTDL
jgi:archaellin